MVGELEEQYMSEHPEVRGLLPRLVEKILAQKPDNISTFAQRYFENEVCFRGAPLSLIVEEYADTFLQHTTLVSKPRSRKLSARDQNN